MLPCRGEIWLADLGMIGKVRPVLIVSVSPGDFDRDLVSIVPRTTKLRGTAYEVPHGGRGFDPGGFEIQNIAGLSVVKCLRRIGVVDGETLGRVEDALRAWLGL